jgi:DNA-binding IclR family transcriptional regulator
LSKRETNGILSSLKLDALTDKTHVTVDALLKELSEIKRQGYALDREEFMEGMIAIAVPIKDKENRFVGALAFHGPTQRISIKNAVERKDTLLNASQKLQEHLF